MAELLPSYRKLGRVTYKILINITTIIVNIVHAARILVRRLKTPKRPSAINIVIIIKIIIKRIIGSSISTPYFYIISIARIFI